MGEYFIIVNPLKQQYLDPQRFGENSKHDGYIHGRHAAVLGLLLCDSPTGFATPPHPLIGAWVGDPVIVAGDGAPANPPTFITATSAEPQRNMYHLASMRFRDISHLALVMLCTAYDPTTNFANAQVYVEDAQQERAFLVELGDIVLALGCEPLHQALIALLGVHWQEDYREACRPYLGQRMYGALERRGRIAPSV